jgi:hypothetical protein
MMPVACDVLRFSSVPWRRLALVALAVTVSIPAAGPALARRPTPGAETKKAEPHPGPVLAVVSLSKQRIHIYGSTGLLAQSSVSSGMAGHRTPPGVFTVLEKRRYHFSNIYDGAPMPYMQRLTWSGIALHGGVVPGYPASHGCVRLPHSFAPEAFGLTTLGTRVVVTPDEPTATPIAHARLPVPRLLPLPSGSEEPSGKIASASGATLTDAGISPGSPKLYNPIERAKAMRPYVVRDTAEKTKLAKLAAETAAAKASDARRASAALNAAESALVAARRRHEAATRAAETASARVTDTASAAVVAAAERAKAALSAAEVDLAAAERRVEEASVIEAVAFEGAAAAAATVIETEHARREASVALKLSEKADAPISILVSKKAGKVFIRQAWTPIHEAPVTFTDTGKDLLGTHVYLAVGTAADGETMNWLSVSLPGTPPAPPRQQRGKRASPAPAAELTSETASSVLARFELPAATRQFIEERLWTGATLIVSDTSASSNETGLHTDFVVLTK